MVSEYRFRRRFLGPGKLGSLEVSHANLLQANAALSLRVETLEKKLE